MEGEPLFCCLGLSLDVCIAPVMYEKTNRPMLGNPGQSWIRDSMQGITFGFQVMIPDLCRWNLDSEFPSLVVFQTQDSGSLGKTLEDSGFQTQKSAGFRNSLHGARQCHIVLEKLSQF